MREKMELKGEMDRRLQIIDVIEVFCFTRINLLLQIFQMPIFLANFKK